MKAIAKQQNGVTFSGFITVLILFIVVAVFSMKLIPSYMENGKIQKAFDTIVRDPAMQTASVKDIRTSFEKSAITMDSVTVINANDIEVEQGVGGLILSATYGVKVPLAGNVSLIIEFNPKAGK